MVYVGQEKLTVKQAVDIYSQVLFAHLPKIVGMSNAGRQTKLGKKLNNDDKGRVLRNTGVSSFINVG